MREKGRDEEFVAFFLGFFLGLDLSNMADVFLSEE